MVDLPCLEGDTSDLLHSSGGVRGAGFESQDLNRYFRHADLGAGVRAKELYDFLGDPDLRIGPALKHLGRLLGDPDV